MNKTTARQKIAKTASSLGLKAQFRSGKADKDEVRILNASTNQVVAQGTIKLDATKAGYDGNDVFRIVCQVKTRLSASKAEDFVIEDGVLKTYSGTEANVVIPNGVTTIGNSAFMFNSDIKTVTIPGSVVKIASEAFGRCTNLAHVKFGKKLADIGDNAFYGCANLKDVDFPGSVTHIGAGAFSGCPNLTSASVPDTVKDIGPGAFDDDSRYQKMNSNYEGPICKYTISEADANMVNNWGYEPGEYTEMLEDGERATEGKFVGFTDDDNWYILFDIPGEGIVPFECVGRPGGFRWYEVKDALNSSTGRSKLNCDEGDDADFVEDVESTVTDEKGNEIEVADMLIVQDPDTNQISLFIPEDEAETVPENVEVIGEVIPADDEVVLDSSRRRKTHGKKMNASKRKGTQNCTNLNSSRANLIEQLEEVYQTSAYTNVEAALAQATGFSESEMEHLPDDDADEGFYANFTTEQLQEALDILNGDDPTSPPSINLALTVTELEVLKRAMEDYSQPSFTKDREMSLVAKHILNKLSDI